MRRRSAKRRVGDGGEKMVNGGGVSQWFGEGADRCGTLRKPAAQTGGADAADAERRRVAASGALGLTWESGRDAGARRRERKRRARDPFIGSEGGSSQRGDNRDGVGSGVVKWGGLALVLEEKREGWRTWRIVPTVDSQGWWRRRRKQGAWGGSGHGGVGAEEG